MKYIDIEESPHIRGSFIATVGCSGCGRPLGYFTSAAGIVTQCPFCGHKFRCVQPSFTSEELAEKLNRGIHETHERGK